MTKSHRNHVPDFLIAAEGSGQGLSNSTDGASVPGKSEGQRPPLGSWFSTFKNPAPLTNTAEASATEANASRRISVEDVCIVTFQWTYRLARFAGSLFGVAFVLAWIATVPLVQLLALGFLVEVTHRVIVSGRFRDGIVGREKGWFLFKLLLGVSLSLIPLYLISRMRFDAWLIAPQSPRHTTMLRWESILFVFTILHLLGAGLCGAQLRHFLWPLLLPYYMGMAVLKRFARWRWISRIIDATVARWFPRSIARFRASRPLSQWFVPAVIWRHLRNGTLLSAASQRFWGFIYSLHLVHYAKLGWGALLGVTLWFAGPTFWILTSTRSINPGVQGILYLFFLVHLFAVLLYFPFVHARFCQTQKIRSYFQWRKAGRTFQYSPMRLTIAMLFSLLLSTPLWLMRIAMVPYDLWWIFAFFYVALLWPTWILWGWASHHGIDAAADTPIPPATRLPGMGHLVLPSHLPVASQLEHTGQLPATGQLEHTGIPTALVDSSPLSAPHSSAVDSARKVRPRSRCSWLWINAWRLVFVALVITQLILTVVSIYICWQGALNILLHPMFHVPTPFGPNA